MIGATPTTFDNIDTPTLTRFRFTPQEAGYRRATVRLPLKNPIGRILQYDIAGVALAPELSVDSTLALGAAVYPGRDRNTTLSISNNGAGALIFDTIPYDIVGADASSFSLPAFDSTDLLPAYSRSVPVRFEPVRVGQHSATLRLFTNDPTVPTKEIALSGSGINVGEPRIFDGARPGISTVGIGGTYSTLADALNRGKDLTGGDWTFQILSDLTENRLSQLAIRSSDGSRVVIRPAAGTTPTVTFTGNTALYVNDSTASLLLEGSNTQGGATRDLTLQTAVSADGYSGVVYARGTNNLTIRNTRIIHNYNGNGPYVYAACGGRPFLDT